jgi:hypothetical protein
MAHVWEFHDGQQRTVGYHNKKWGCEMMRIGLHPTPARPGGRMTGYSVTHYIMREGMYAEAYAKLKATGFKLHWQSEPHTKERKKKRESKTKYTCPHCGQNAWSKPNARLVCGDCKLKLIAEKPVGARSGHGPT